MSTDIKLKIQSNNSTAYYQKLISFALSENERFFDFNLGRISLSVFNDRGDFERAINLKNTPNWMVAYVKKNELSTIYLLDQNLDKVQVKQILTHEVAHLQINKLNNNLEFWVKEGLAVYVAKQFKKDEVKKTDWQNFLRLINAKKRMSTVEFANNNGYVISSFFISYLIKKLGKETFINILQKQQKNDNLVKTLENQRVDLSFKEISKKRAIIKFIALFSA